MCVWTVVSPPDVTFRFAVNKRYTAKIATATSALFPIRQSRTAFVGRVTTKGEAPMKKVIGRSCYLCVYHVSHNCGCRGNKPDECKVYYPQDEFEKDTRRKQDGMRRVPKKM